MDIIIVGQAGSEKSTLYNLLQRDKNAREGRGEFIIYKISFYDGRYYNTAKIDTPDF